jgi:hypothetical protein
MSMNRFESNAGRIGEHSEKEALLEAAYKKARTLLDAHAIDMNEFRSVYSDMEIRNDAAKVANYERMFAAEATERGRRDKELATVVEAIFFDQVGRNGWLGPDTQVLPSSKLDDYVHGVDFITEYNRGNIAAYLAMAIDATWSSHPGGKFNRIREDLVRGKLGKIKYFKAGGKPQRGREVPKVVVGASERALTEVIKLWMDGNDEALKDHPVQILFLEEIVDQLKGFRIFSQKRGHAKNVAIFDEYLAILGPILEEKKKEIPPSPELKNDLVRNGINASLVGLNYEFKKAA